MEETEQIAEGRKTDTVRTEFVYEIARDQWENPEKIRNLRVNLPNGTSARFMRVEAWEPRPYIRPDFSRQ